MLSSWTQPHHFAAGSAFTVRQAGIGDIGAISFLVHEQARRGHLLPRSPDAIRASLGDWLVAVTNSLWPAGSPVAANGGDQQIVGCVSLLSYHPGLAEVRSLAVADQAQGQGVGGKLLLALVAEARNRRVPVLFAMTRAVGFFESCGFRVTDRALFPEKVWQVCRTCPLQDRCDETAVVLDLTDLRHEDLPASGR